MGIRYNNRRKITNSDEIYEELFDGRGVKEITSYGTARFKELTIQNRYSLTNKHHMWSTGDSFWKLASEGYGGFLLGIMKNQQNLMYRPANQ